MQLSEQAFQTPFFFFSSPLLPFPAQFRLGYCRSRESPLCKVIYERKALRTNRLRVRKPAKESQSGATEES